MRRVGMVGNLVRVSMNVDKPRRHHRAGRVDDVLRLSAAQRAHLGDAAVDDADVRLARGGAGAIDDAAAGDEHVKTWLGGRRAADDRPGRADRGKSDERHDSTGCEAHGSGYST